MRRFKAHGVIWVRIRIKREQPASSTRVLVPQVEIDCRTPDGSTPEDAAGVAGNLPSRR